MGVAGGGAVDPKTGKKAITWSNLAVGAAMNIFEVATLGQPFEVLKTHMGAHRNDGLLQAFRASWRRGGLFGFYQGLFPWAMIEASTKGAILMLSQAEFEYMAKKYAGVSSTWASAIGGMGGGIVQAYTTMGFCTFMKTVEVTRHKDPAGSQKSTLAVARDIIREKGILAMNRGVTAVAVRQCTNWGTRFGASKYVENLFKAGDPNKQLSNMERLSASVVGGIVGCWNQPIEVIRIQMQSAVKGTESRQKVSIVTAAKEIYAGNGLLGFYRGVTPRVGLGIWQTTCMVFMADNVKALIAGK